MDFAKSLKGAQYSWIDGAESVLLHNNSGMLKGALSAPSINARALKDLATIIIFLRQHSFQCKRNHFWVDDFVFTGFFGKLEIV